MSFNLKKIGKQNETVQVNYKVIEVVYIQISNDDLLKYAVQNGIINLSYVQEQVNMNRRKELLSRHPYNIWCGKDGYWRTYVYDESKQNNRRLIKRKEKAAVEDVAIEGVLECKEIEENKKKSEATLLSLFPQWIKYKTKHTLSSSSIKRITATWKKYYVTQPDLINKLVCEFTKIELDNWAHDMIKNNSMTKKQYYNMSIILRQELDFAVEQGIIEENVFSKVKINTKMFRKEKKKSGESQVYMTDEISKIINEMLRRFAADKSDTAPLAVLLDFETGLRIGELVALKSTDISSDWSTIHIQRQCVRTYKNVDDDGFVMKFDKFEVVDYTKSDDGDRFVYLTETAKNIIRMVMLINQLYNYKCDDFLFVKKNKMITQYAIQARLLRGCETIGINTKSSHKIRKTYISSLIDSGLNIDEIRRQVGHSDERTTYGNYCFNRRTSDETRSIMEAALKYNGNIEIAPLQKVIKSNQKSTCIN